MIYGYGYYNDICKQWRTPAIVPAHGKAAFRLSGTRWTQTVYEVVTQEQEWITLDIGFGTIKRRPADVKLAA